MEFRIQLYLREHHNGFYSIEVIGEPSLSVYTPDLETAREDLELVLSDKLERTHPGRLHRYAAADNLRHVDVDISDVVLVEDEEGEEGHQTTVSVLVARDRRWQRLWMPRWDLRTWIPVREEVPEAVEVFLADHLKKLSPHKRLALRAEGKEWIETLTVEADPPPLLSFTGKLLGAAALPEPIPKDDEEDDDDDDDDDEGEGEEGAKKDRAPKDADKRSPKKKKKKRPPTPTLKKIGTNMSQLAKDGELERGHGRQRELEDLLATLSAKGTCAVALIGASGVGKSTLLGELVYQIRRRRGPTSRKKRSLRSRPVFFADASRLIAGDGWFGDWQRQCLDVIQECVEAEVIWYIGDLLALLDAGKSIHSDQNVALLLKPYLAGKRLTIIGECTPASWARLELRDAGFSRLFTPYRLEEPEREETREILAAVADDVDEEFAVRVDVAGLRAIEDLCRRYNADSSHLGASIHFLRRIAEDAATRAEEAGLEEDIVLSRPEVVARFCAETGMPGFLIRDDTPLDPAAVWLHFRQRVIGQIEAVRRMTDLVSLMKAGLSDAQRPLGSFLFVGPTGVGKTEMAKALAEFLFGRRDRMIRFDMSEFVRADSVHRFLGDGGQEGQLISQIRRWPFCVLLLDEIEKAHPAVFDVLLQVLGEARLTDQAGRTADFRNTVVLMTSNLGVDTFRERAGFGGGGDVSFKEHFSSEARRFFRPEFLGRIDHIVPFMPLERDAIDMITKREVDKWLGREGIKQRELTVELDADVRGWLADRGVEPRYGARPLKRLIEKSLTAPLARHLSTLTAHPGRTVDVAPDGEALAFVDADAKTGGKLGRSPRGKLLKALDHIKVVRYQIQRWRASGLASRITQSVRLFDRLSQDRNFWADAERAQARSQEAGVARALSESVEALYDRVNALEDLAYELYYDGNDEPLTLLYQDLAACMDDLDKIEVELYSHSFNNSARAVLYLQCSSDGEALLRVLIRFYADFAVARGWTCRTWYALEDIEAVLEREEQRAKKLSEGKGGSAPKKDKVSKDFERWSWASHTKPLTPRKEEESARAHASRVSAFVDDAMRGRMIGETKVIVFEGPGACLLAAEHGVHQEIDASTSPQVKIRYVDSLQEQLDHPLVAAKAFTGKRKRVIHRNKRLLFDFDLETHDQLGSRIDTLYKYYIQSFVYREVFGPGTFVSFKRDAIRAALRQRRIKASDADGTDVDQEEG